MGNGGQRVPVPPARQAPVATSRVGTGSSQLKQALRLHQEVVIRFFQEGRSRTDQCLLGIDTPSSACWCVLLCALLCLVQISMLASQMFQVSCPQPTCFTFWFTNFGPCLRMVSQGVSSLAVCLFYASSQWGAKQAHHNGFFFWGGSRISDVEAVFRICRCLFESFGQVRELLHTNGATVQFNSIYWTTDNNMTLSKRSAQLELLHKSMLIPDHAERTDGLRYRCATA